MRYTGENKAHNYTIMVKKVPEFITYVFLIYVININVVSNSINNYNCRSSEQLADYFKKFFGGKVVAAHMPLPSNDIRRLLKKRDKTVKHLQECETLTQNAGPLKQTLCILSTCHILYYQFDE